MSALMKQANLNTVDFILISHRAYTNPAAVSDLPEILSHHSCHNSIRSSNPISWSLNSPKTIYHNFSASFCEIKLKMIIRNTSEGLASVSINTSDSIPDTSPTPSFGYQSGWRYVPSITEEMKLTSDVMGSSSRHGGKSASAMESSPPFIWSGLCSTKIQIQPLSTTEIELQISAFSPGVYNLSSYTLNWELSHHENASLSSSSSRSSGTCEGYPHYLTVLQSQ